MRRPISSKQRYAILERDNFCCQVCGAAAPNVTLHVDHIISVVEGGDNDENNLRAICITCNLGKGAQSAKPARPVPPVQYPIRIADNEVFCRSEPLSTPIFWIGEQWAVTASGLEARDGTYFVEKHRLWESDGPSFWKRHIGRKTWANGGDLDATIDWAIQNQDLLLRTNANMPAEEAAE